MVICTVPVNFVVGMKEILLCTGRHILGRGFKMPMEAFLVGEVSIDWDGVLCYPVSLH